MNAASGLSFINHLPAIYLAILAVRAQRQLIMQECRIMPQFNGQLHQTNLH